MVKRFLQFSDQSDDRVDYFRIDKFETVKTVKHLML